MEKAVMCASVVMSVFQYGADRFSYVFTVERYGARETRINGFPSETGDKRDANSTVRTGPSLTLKQNNSCVNSPNRPDNWGLSLGGGLSIS
jgi:hypothetical protein